MRLKALAGTLLKLLENPEHRAAAVQAGARCGGVWRDGENTGSAHGRRRTPRRLRGFGGRRCLFCLGICELKEGEDGHHEVGRRRRPVFGMFFRRTETRCLRIWMQRSGCLIIRMAGHHRASVCTRWKLEVSQVSLTSPTKGHSTRYKDSWTSTSYQERNSGTWGPVHVDENRQPPLQNKNVISQWFI